MMRFASVILFGALLFGAESRWIRLKSSNFEMYTTANERNARDTLKHFEQVRGFFAQLMGAIPGKTLPVRIIAFNTRKEYEPYRLNSFAQAFYHSTPTSDDIVLSEVGPEVFPVAIHEYVHLVIRHAGLTLPPWLNEGMAELYSTLRPQGDKVIVGDMIQGRFQALHREPWVPLALIVGADRNSPYYNEKSQAGSLYNEGWALTHMMVLSSEYRPQFAKFMSMVSAGTSTSDALLKVYGKTIEQVDKELQTYLTGFQFKAAIFPQRLEKIVDEIPAQPAAPFDVKLVLAELKNIPGKESEAFSMFRDLAAEDPRRPEPHAGLGYLAFKEQHLDIAVREFAKAFELGDRDPVMLWDLGRMGRGRDDAAATRALAALVAAQPERLEARMELAAMQLVSHQPDAALETLKPVKKVTPEDAARFYTILTHAQLDKQMFNEALVNAENLKKFAKKPEDQAQAESILTFLNARTAAPYSVKDPGEERRQALVSREPPLSAHRTLKGLFVELDCSGKSARLMVEATDGKKIFLIDSPDHVMGETTEFTCGPQRNKAQVTIDFIPSNETGVDGLLRGITFR